TGLARKHFQPLLNQLDKQLKKVQLQIRQLIQEDEKLKQLTKIVTSVPGVGEIVCWKLLVVTNEFKDLRDGRKFACYSGVAPFAYTSGISIKGRAKVSNMANKDMKKLLHMAAVASIGKGKGELYDYFHRKVKQGKHKMSIINAVRNKIIHRVFACVSANREYDYSYINALV
ncbi:transposase, partial [Limibacter armeniacum]